MTRLDRVRHEFVDTVPDLLRMGQAEAGEDVSERVRSADVARHDDIRQFAIVKRGEAPHRHPRRHLSEHSGRRRA